MQKLERPYTCLLFVVNESLSSEVNTPHSWSFRTHSMQATCLQNITMSCKRRRVCMHALQTMYGGQLGSTHRTAGAIILIQMPQGAYPATMMTQSTWSKQTLPFHPSRQSKAAPVLQSCCAPTTIIPIICQRSGSTHTATCRGCRTTCTACMAAQGH